MKDEEARLDLDAAKAFGDDFRRIKSLDFVTDCLSRIFKVFEQNSSVLSVFVHIPAGQQVIRALLHHGKTISADPRTSESDRMAWTLESDKFYALMRIAVSKLELESAGQ